MELYAIFREGVYRHECGGVFTTKENAKAAIEELKGQEPDDYHEWVCVPFVADVVMKGNGKPGIYSYAVNEPDAIEV